MQHETNDTATHPDAPAPADPSELQKQRDDFYDRLLRKTAEFDNYRKRIERERQQVTEAAAADILEELLPIVDDLERALSAQAGSDGADAYRRGIPVTGIRRIYPPEANGALGPNADGCASCCRRFGVWRPQRRAASCSRATSGYGSPSSSPSPAWRQVCAIRAEAALRQPPGALIGAGHPREAARGARRRDP